jgi:hypothetical protein
MTSIHTSCVIEKGRSKPAYEAPSSSTLPASALSFAVAARCVVAA